MGGEAQHLEEFGQHGLMRRPTPAFFATLVAVVGAALFVLVQMQPRLLFTATTPNGGDMGAHVWGPAFMRDHLLPDFRITGWAPDWYAGFAFPAFYFPLPSLLIVLADLVMPYEVAFKVVSVAGLVTLPVAAWAFGRLAGLKSPGPACLAVATVPFLFDRSFSIYGGNIASTLAGEFSYSISLSLALVFLGVLARGLRTGRHRALAAALLALTLMAHVVPTFFAVAGALVLTLLRPSVRKVAHTVVVGVVAGLVAAVWALPFVWRLPFTNDMGYEKITQYRQNLELTFDSDLRWLVLLGAVGAVISIIRWERVGVFLTIMAGLAAVGFRFVPQGKIWNPRILPFWFLCLYLLAGLALASLAWGLAWLAARRRQDQPDGAERAQRAAATVAPLVVLGVTLVYVSMPLHLPVLDRAPLKQALAFFPVVKDRSYIPDWAKWNYNGYERKSSWPEHEAIIDTMAEIGRTEGCGRAHWEYEGELDQLGTPLALMLLPYWTDGCIGSMEGLYFESSATTPYHFLSAAELSRKASRPQRGLPYRDFDLIAGVRHLQLLGARYYMAFSTEAKAAAAQHPDLTLVGSTDCFPVRYSTGEGQRCWEMYEVAGAELVTPLANEPVVAPAMAKGEKAWLDASAPWFMDADRPDVFLAAGGPDDWRRVRSTERTLPARPVPPAQVSRIDVDGDRISFDVSRTGTPVLVKASYFPNWEASGADGPWRVTPNLMVVVPTSRHVELRYGTTPVDLAGWVLSGLGLVALIVLARLKPAPLEPEPEPAAESELGLSAWPWAQSEPEPDQPPYGPGPPPEDGRPRRPGLPDRHRDLGHRQAGPLGPEDELGVEQVGAETRLLDERQQRRPAHGFHAVRVRDPEAEPPPEDEGED